MIWLTDSLPKEFHPDERLLRAVFPANKHPEFWKNGRLSSAALKDKKGLSVERTYTRSVDESVRYMLTHLSGNVVSLTQDSCKSVSAIILYLPTCNLYHCEIHGGKDRKVLSPSQAHAIARSAELVYSITITVN